jgi:hypothetical protein
LARQGSGWLSVSRLGAVSAESYGRDSFAESAGTWPARVWYVLLKLATIKRNEIEADCRNLLKHILRLISSVGPGSSIRLPF